MTTPMIRKFDPVLKEKRRIRAAHAGRSTEAELRSIVSAALSREPEPEENLAVAMRRLFGPLNGVDLEPHPFVPVREPPTFG